MKKKFFLNFFQMNITLNEDQKKQYENILNIWETSKIAINVAVMGSGKTYVTSKLGENFNCMFVVCPANIEFIWENMAKIYNLEIEIISYDNLSSVKGRQPSHKYLTREDTNDYPTFKCTKKFKKLVEKKCLIVADEFQNMKNKNSRYYAFKSLLKFLDEKDSDSRAIILSGTPYDKKIHVLNTLQMVNIIKTEDIYNYNNNRLEYLGINDLIEYSRNIDEENTELILSENFITHKNIIDICYKLYIDIIQHKLISSMPSPKLKIGIECYNCYLNMTEKASEKLKEGIDMLKNLNKKYQTIEGSNERKAITTALIITQMAKTEIFARMAKFLLNENETNKIVLFFDFDEPINETAYLLKDYNPIVINGKINKRERPSLIEKFQENNSESRLLIFNMSIGCEGISLDDIHGGYKRYALGAPNYYIQRMHQMSRRFYRASTISTPTIYFVYGICGEEETSLINSLARKTNIMKETLTMQVSEGVLFPSDYKKLVENGNMEFKEVNSKIIELKNESVDYCKKVLKKEKFSFEINLKPNVRNNLLNF